MPATMHYADQLILSLRQREQAYNVLVPVWDDTTASLMTDIDDATVHEVWEDTVTGAAVIRLGQTLPTSQAVQRQRIRIPFTQPRVTPHTLAGLLGLAFGQVTSVQQPFLTSRRHALVPTSLVTSPSLSAMTGHQGHTYYQYGGFKPAGWTLSWTTSSPYLAFTMPLVGSGSRTAIATPATLPQVVQEPWVTLGHSRLWLTDVTDAPLTWPTTPPVQGVTNLSGTVLDVSTRVLSWSVTQQQALPESVGRVSAGLVSSTPYARQRTWSVTLTLEVDTATEADELGWYLTQHAWAMEWQWTSPEVIDPVIVLSLIHI